MKYLALLLLVSCTPLTLKPVPECTHLIDEMICTFPSGYQSPRDCVRDGKSWLCPNDSVAGYQCTNPAGKKALEKEISSYLEELRQYRQKCGSVSGCKKR